MILQSETFPEKVRPIFQIVEKSKKHLSVTMMPANGVAIFMLILAYAVQCDDASLVHDTNESAVVETVPVMKAGRTEMMVMINENRRKLGSFQICALCTCCGGAKGICLPSPCCYAINCNIPNRPFGFCSFTPKTCNCFGCHL